MIAKRIVAVFAALAVGWITYMIAMIMRYTTGCFRSLDAKQMRSSGFAVLMFVAVVAACSGCHGGAAHTDSAAQQVVDALVALQPSADHRQLAAIMRGGTVSNKFDVNQYFTVLSRLSPDKGYVLDWVYWGGDLGGRPVLYAREANASPFASFDSYAANPINIPPTEVSSASSASERLQFGYIERLRVNDSPEGYFQLVVLRLLGDRFHMFWHERYNETFLVCSKSAWESLLQREKKRGKPYDPPPPSFITTADKLDFTPTVQIGDNQVEVVVTTYSPFGGLDLHSFVIARQFPHRILRHTETNLLRHTQRFVF